MGLFLILVVLSIVAYLVTVLDTSQNEYAEEWVLELDRVYYDAAADMVIVEKGPPEDRQSNICAKGVILVFRELTYIGEL